MLGCCVLQRFSALILCSVIIPCQPPVLPGSSTHLLPPQDYTRLVRDFAAFYQQHRAELPRRVFWQQTTALHYNTPTGEGGAGGSPFRCAPLKGISIQVGGLGWLVDGLGAAPLRAGQHNVALSRPHPIYL